MMIEKGPSNSTSHKIAEQYLESFRQEKHLYTQALPIELLYELFSFCDRATLEQATEALPRFKWVYDNKVEIYKSLICRYFPFLQRTQPAEFEENPQELFLRTIKRLCSLAPVHNIRNSAAAYNIPTDDILDALDGNDAKIKAKYASKKQSFIVKIMNAVSSFWEARGEDNPDPDPRNLDLLNLLLTYKKYLTTHTLNKDSFSRVQILALKRIAIFFGNLDLLKEIVQSYNLTEKRFFSWDPNHAAMDGHTNILVWILDYLVAECSKKDPSFEDIFRFSETIHVEAFKIIFSRYIVVQHELDSTLVKNAELKSGYAIIEYMFSLSKDLCAFSPQIYCQALEIAFKNNHMKIVDFLLSKDEYADTLITHRLDPKLEEYLFKRKQEKMNPILDIYQQYSQKRKYEENMEDHSDPTLTRHLKKTGK